MTAARIDRMTDLEAFESCRPALLGLGYRMLGDFARAEDLVHEAWLNWQHRAAEVAAPKAYLTKTVLHLCLNEIDSARVRREESRGDRLPEPVDLSLSPLDRVEVLEHLSMAFLVLLQRLTAAERAVLVLHAVFDFSHAEIAAMLGRSTAACRQLLKRARAQVAAERRTFTVSEEEHRRLLSAFTAAAVDGRLDDLAALLAGDAVLIADAGPDGGRFGQARNLPGPLVGAHKVAAFVAAVTPQGAVGSSVRECQLNGQPAVLVMRDGRPYAAILLAVADGRIRQVFIHADPARLRSVTGK
jgi:RNA polymerase sigma-70 factor (ECF subfamily)